MGRCKFHSSSALVCAAVQSTESVSPAICTNSTSYRARGLSKASITSMMDGVGASTLQAYVVPAVYVPSGKVTLTPKPASATVPSTGMVRTRSKLSPPSVES